MKGVHDYFGSERLELLLISSGGSGKRTLDREAEFVERYDMQSYPQVRMDRDQFTDQVTRTLGQFGYGKIVIDRNGNLVALDVGRDDLPGFLALACGVSDPRNALKEFELTAELQDVEGGRAGLLGLSDVLTTDLTAVLRLTLTMPEGWYIGGGVTPTVAVKYAGGAVMGEAQFQHADSASASKLVSPVIAHLPLTVLQGTGLGYHLAHGTLRFVACTEDRCLPPVELSWKAVIEVL